MRLGLAVVSTIIYLLWSTACLATQGQFHIVTFHSPPYSMKSGNQQVGITTNVVRSMLNRLKLSEPVTTYPLERGLRIAAKEPNVLIYPVERNLQTEHQYHWVGRISQPHAWLFKLHDRHDIQLESLEQAKQYVIGVTRGSVIANKLKRIGFTQLYEVTTDIQSMLMLEKQRVDLIASDELILYHLIDTHNRASETKLTMQHFRKLMPITHDKSELYIAMSKPTSKHIVARFKDAFEQVTDSGKYLEIAHWWTNLAERPQLNVYQNALKEKGYQWVDYTFEGGAGVNMLQLLEADMETPYIPHAIQTYLSQVEHKWEDSSTLLALDDVATQFNWKDVLPAFVHQNIKHNGHYYSVPVNLQRVNWMWVNPAVFAAAGAALPHDWPSFFDAADKIQQNGITPISIGSYAWQEGTLFEVLVLSIGGVAFHKQSLIDLTPSAFRSPTMHKVLETLKRLKHYSNYQDKSQDWINATHNVIDGKAAIYFMGDWAKAVFRQHNIPYGEQGYLCLAAPDTANLFLLNTDTFIFPKAGNAYEQGQKTLATIIMSKPVQEEFNRVKGSIPARQDISPARFDECAQKAMHIAKTGTIVPSFNFHQIHPEKIHKPITETIHRFFRDDIAISDTANTLADIVAQYQQERRTQGE